ncbi:hypothetical protein Ancab_007588, partial [Ancistrocladus abbreviatus]
GESGSTFGERAGGIKDQRAILISPVPGIIRSDGGHQSNGPRKMKGWDTDKNNDFVSLKAHDSRDANEDQSEWQLVASQE